MLGRSGSYTNVLYLLCKSAMNQWVQSVHDGTKAAGGVGSCRINMREFTVLLRRKFPPSSLVNDEFTARSSSSLSLRLQTFNSVIQVTR